MPISDDWIFDYANKVIQHVDGVLSYDGGTTGQAAVGDYVIGGTSGAIGKVISRTGTAASGTYTLTNVKGLFQDNEAIELLSTVAFDAVTAGNGGFKVGDTIVDQVTGSVVVRAIEYNTDGAGGGQIWGDTFTAFTDNSQLDISGGQADVADADTVTANTDNDTAIDTALVNGTLAVPGTANTNDCVIIHFDAGTLGAQIPEQAIVEDATTGAIALVEQYYGSTDGTTGSLRLVDYNSTGAFTDNNTLRCDQVIAYDGQVAGEVFSVGDVVVGATSGATGRVLFDTGTELILADESGTWTNNENLQVGGVTIALANGTNTTLNVATIDIPEGIRTEQRPNAVGGSVGQGGIFASGDSLNIVRKFNSFYTYSQDTFDELTQLDDDEAVEAFGRGTSYALTFSWRFEENTEVGAFRFLRQGGVRDTTNANIWANPQTVGAQNKITDTAFDYSSAQPYKQPQLYVERDGAKIDSWWLEGNIDILLRTKTRNDPRYIDPVTPGLGQLIPGGDPAVNGSYTIFNREFHVSTYDATQGPAGAEGVNTIALGTQPDVAADRNPNGTHTMNYTGGSAAALIVGEEFYTTAGNSQKVGIVVSDTGGVGATGTLEYVLKSGTNFVNTDSCTGAISGKTFTAPTPTNVVAGYGSDIRFNVCEIALTPSGGTGITGTFIPGEGVTQAVTGATGYVVAADGNTLYVEKNNATAFSGDNDVTGDVSSASWDAGTGATYPSAVTFNADLNNGEGSQPYAGSVGANIANTGAETIQNVYQWSKYQAAAEQAALSVAGPGTAGVDDASTLGQIYRRLKNAYTEIKPGNPFGPFTGSMAFAQGWFLDTGYIAAADIRSFTVVDDNGVTRAPPNLQSLTISGVAAGWRVAAFRSTGVGNTAILRNEFDVGTVGAGNNQAANSTILVGANNRTVGPLPADVPDTGVLYVLDPNDTGNYLQFPYSSVNRTTNIFTLTSGTIGDVTGGQDLTLDDNVHVAFIREQAAGATVSNTIQYVANIPIVYVGRLKGYDPFRGTGEFVNTGATLPVNQTDDTIVDLP